MRRQISRISALAAQQLSLERSIPTANSSSHLLMKQVGIVLATPSMETVQSDLYCRENVESSVAPEVCLESRQCREICGWLSMAGGAALWLREVSCPVRLLQIRLMGSSGERTSGETFLLLLFFLCSFNNQKTISMQFTFSLHHLILTWILRASLNFSCFPSINSSVLFTTTAPHTVDHRPGLYLGIRKATDIKI